MEKLYLGIDVGKNGGFSFINNEGELVKTMIMPVIGKIYDYNAIKEIFTQPIKHIVIEDVHSIFGMGAEAQFQFGMGKGIIIAMAVASEIPYTLVSPKKWQKEMWDSTSLVTKPTKRKLKDGSYSRKTDTKKTSLVAARRLFPKEKFLPTVRCSVPHDGMVDASLMALYGYRRFK